MSQTSLPAVVRAPARLIRTVKGIATGLSLTGSTTTSSGRATEGPARSPDPDSGLEVDAPDESVSTLGVGDSVSFSKTIGGADVQRFADATGDTNPLHLDDDHAATTTFDGCIAPGLLVAGVISAALARLPGTVVYLSQDLQFQHPVYPEDRVIGEVEIVESLGDGRYRLLTSVENDGETAIRGEAVVLISDASDT